jgi:hypothetical protein
VKNKGKPVINHLYSSTRNLLILLLLNLLSVPLCRSAQVGTTEDIAWKSLETKYTIIHYQSAKDLGKFCAKVKYGPKDWGLRVLLSGTRPGYLVMDIASKKTDILFEKVQDILGMRKEMEKVNIRIYQNEAQLHEAYSEIYQGACNIRAWYRQKNNTVYVNASDLQEGVIAHELTHAIVDHYLLVRPPRPTAEIIARYVGSHLKREVRSYDQPEPFFGLGY